MENEPQKPKNQRDWVEEMEVAGNELVDRVKTLVAEGNVRRLIIRNANNEILIEVPLTSAVVVGGVAAVISPVLAALGAMAALFAKLKLDVVRAEEIDEDAETILISGDDVTDVTPSDD
ncbi:MAG: DUF4342 domain-containing protein [Chloroflexota bacterium]|nr:DUF4342 domain-containing protein [Chloroflexota bacterium]